jgi:hypothetical protein
MAFRYAVIYLDILSKAKSPQPALWRVSSGLAAQA